MDSIQHPKIKEVIEKWKNTAVGPLVTPLLIFIERNPHMSLFLGILLCFSSLPLLCVLIFLVTTLSLTLCGSLMFIASFFSIGLAFASVIIFASLFMAGIFTGVTVLVYNSATSMMNIFKSSFEN